MVLVIFTSGTSKRKLIKSNLENGNYSISTTGDIQKKFKGVIYFETVDVTSSKGIRYNTLKLGLKNHKNHQMHSMQFLISKKTEKGQQIKTGTYKVANNIDGFINCFDGVFGFANIRSSGELPFFANSGKIKIEYISQDVLKGTIEVAMNNSERKRINIQGNFTANRKN
ncbi:MAG: hypothetical protein COA50_15020 [Flavobacteriaceae bacterium]|nr:MAG: hypothetical protein COA50_15020 [Flavobacteriaceae bacterium]